MLISTFAVLGVGPASASGEAIIGSMSIDDSSFLRCYDWSYEQSCTGYPSQDKFDTAYLTATLPPMDSRFDNNQFLQARLFKVLKIDGEVVATGLEIPIPAEGPYPTMYIPISRTGGAIWVDSQYFYYNYYSGNQLTFSYDLSWSGLTYGYDIWPNYWSTQDFTDAVNGHVWNGHTYEISFAVEWWNFDGAGTKVGATDDIPSENNRHGFSCSTTHTEQGWESWKWMIPDNEIHFACSTPWTETYGSASITGATDAQFRVPDSYYGTFLASSSGAFARAAYWIGGPCTGTIYVHGNSLNSPFSRFLVYASNDNYNWQPSSEQLVYNSGDRWIDCGNPGITYQYVMVMAYDSGSDSYMKVNCINAGGHY